MSRRAQVKSIDALQDMAAALDCFRADAIGALDNLEMEIRRAVDWLNQDCKTYWAGEVRQGWQSVYEAQVQLQQAVTYRSVAEHKPTCDDEKKAVQRARQRLQTAQIKLEAVAHWAIVVERAINEYRGNRAHLTNWIDSELPQAVAALGRMTSALETYVTLGSPADEVSPVKWATTSTTEEIAPEQNYERNIETGGQSGQVSGDDQERDRLARSRADVESGGETGYDKESTQS
jgi:hypothetical protein